MRAHLLIQPDKIGVNVPQERFDLPGVLRVERAEIFFTTSSPLPKGAFPGPALRGILGRCVDHFTNEAFLDFWNHRFKGEKISWKLAFHNPPTESGFSVKLTTMGPHAREDLCAILAALSRPSLKMMLPGFSTLLHIERAKKLSGITIEYMESSTEKTLISSKKNTCADLQFSLLTPTSIHQNGHPLRIEQWYDATPILDSIRLRFADLSGMMKKSIAQAPPHIHLDTSRLMEVQIPMPIRGKHQMLTGAIGDATIDSVDPYTASLLHTAEIIGIGRSTSFGLGTLTIHPSQLHHQMP